LIYFLGGFLVNICFVSGWSLTIQRILNIFLRHTHSTDSSIWSTMKIFSIQAKFNNLHPLPLLSFEQGFEWFVSSPCASLYRISMAAYTVTISMLRGVRRNFWGGCFGIFLYGRQNLRGSSQKNSSKLNKISIEDGVFTPKYAPVHATLLSRVDFYYDTLIYTQKNNISIISLLFSILIHLTQQSHLISSQMNRLNNFSIKKYIFQSFHAFMDDRTQ